MLRSLAISALIFFAASAAHAKCMHRAIFVWPEAETKLPAEHALVVVNGFGEDQDVVFDVKEAFLVDGKTRIPMKVVHRARGDFNLTQIALEATKPLKVGAQYKLDLGVTSREQWTWTAGDADRDPPKWISPPGAQPGEVHELGCGPSIEVPVKVPVENADAHMFLVVLDDGSPSETARQFMIRARDGTLQLGHGMCSGPFRLRGDHPYTAQIFALDGAGNRTSSPARVSFKGPVRRERE